MAKGAGVLLLSHAVNVTQKAIRNTSTHEAWGIK